MIHFMGTHKIIIKRNIFLNVKIKFRTSLLKMYLKYNKDCLAKVFNQWSYNLTLVCCFFCFPFMYFVYLYLLKIQRI